MALSAYNVRTRRKEPFLPLDPAGRKVGLYVCGLTVYDHVHIGHARTYAAFEVIRRWLESSYQVTYVKNVTDVDDKIIARAAESGRSPREHAAEWDARCEKELLRLGVRPPDRAPHVTDSIPQIIAFTQGILAKGFAYATPAGNVYFDVPRYDEAAQRLFPQCAYGTLSNRDFKDMEAGTRKTIEEDKRHPADFALWKAAKPGDHPDACWDSPWGMGRPGWHIECSAMSAEALGDRIDIHGGGQDLIFPHHENEVAQSQARSGHAPFVNLWLHTGFLNVEGEKMSKSLGNFVTLQGMLDELAARGMDAEDLRFYFLQTHYRSKIDHQRKGLDEAHTALQRLHRTRDLLAEAVSAHTVPGEARDATSESACQTLREAFRTAMDDDFHTPSAIAALFDFCRQLNPDLEAHRLAPAAARKALTAMEECGAVLTLFTQPARPTSAALSQAHLPAALTAFAEGQGIAASGRGAQAVLDALVDLRAEARKAKDFARGDAIRDALKAAGFALEDTAQGQRWRRLP